jgi:hypothetical protein
MCESNSDSERLIAALPSATELICDVLVPELWLSAHRDAFLRLFLEAYRAYKSGCPRASIIMAGESLLRAVFARIEAEVIQQGAPLTVRLRNGKAKTVGQSFDDAAILDELTFCDALDLSRQNHILSEPVLDIAYTVKDLRNRAVHGQLPLLDDWDPDDPRPRVEFEQMRWDRSLTIPEGYRFIPCQKRGWFSFDCRRQRCSSLKGLTVEQRYAAIQYCLVTDAVLGVFGETIRPGDRVRRKGTEREGTMLESDALSRVYRAVRWADGHVEDEVRITEIERTE